MDERFNHDDMFQYNVDDYHANTEGKPQWFKLWANKYADVIDINNLDSDLKPDEKERLFREIGIAFINSLFYFQNYYSSKCPYYEPKTRDGRIIWNALQRDVRASYEDYEKRVENGKKGGRPPKKNNE